MKSLEASFELVNSHEIHADPNGMRNSVNRGRFVIGADREAIRFVFDRPSGRPRLITIRKASVKKLRDALRLLTAF